MQDEVNEKVVSLAIKTSKLTAEVLQKAMKALLAKGKGQLTKAPHGKITMRQLMKQGEKVSNIEITDQNIKAFDPTHNKIATILFFKFLSPLHRNIPALYIVTQYTVFFIFLISYFLSSFIF